MIPGGLSVWLAGVLVLVAILTHRRWQPEATARFGLTPQTLRWYLLGFPVTVIRMRWWWKQTCLLADLSISPRGTRGLVGGLVVRGSALRQVAPRLGIPWPTRDGLVVTVKLHAGQTPRPFLAASEAFEHAWRVWRVRGESRARGEVVIIVTAVDPLARVVTGEAGPEAARLLAPVIGRAESGPWVADLRAVPHWLVVGGTQSGKSNWISALLTGLAHQPVGLLGIDLKGGLELGQWSNRLTALAETRAEARAVLEVLVGELGRRMRMCRAAGVRAVWELMESEPRPEPVVVVIDELAELTLTDGSKEARDDAAACSAALLRLVQLGAALDLHVVVAAQRAGSDLGPLVTSIRAQLPGRVVHRVSDAASAEMALGDLVPDAVMAALSISATEKGVAITLDGGRWQRARATHISTEAALRTAADTADLRPALSGLTLGTAP